MAISAIAVFPVNRPKYIMYLMLEEHFYQCKVPSDVYLIHLKSCMKLKQDKCKTIFIWKPRTFLMNEI